MAEYINRDALFKHYIALANIEWNNKVSPPSWSYAYESFIDHLEELPTADVVPKSEYDRLEKLFNDMTQEAKGYLNRLYGIRADAAREIFEEIERLNVVRLTEDYWEAKKKYT